MSTSFGKRCRRKNLKLKKKQKNYKNNKEINIATRKKFIDRKDIPYYSFFLFFPVILWGCVCV